MNLYISREKRAEECLTNVVGVCGAVPSWNIHDHSVGRELVVEDDLRLELARALVHGVELRHAAIVRDELQTSAVRLQCLRPSRGGIQDQCKKADRDREYEASRHIWCYIEREG